MRNLTIAIFAVAALSTAAEAKPHKVVVVDFDGLPRNLADTGRSNVMSLLGNEYDLVPTKKWESARAAAGRGPAQFQQAAKSSGVDAVIEGFVNTEGRHHTLTVLVRDSLTGNEIDSVSVSIGEKGLSNETAKSLTTQLDDILTWIDPDSTSEDVHLDLKPLTKETLGAFHPKHHDDDVDDDDSRDSRDSRESTRRHRARPSLRHVQHDDDYRDNDRDDEHRRDDRDRDEPRRTTHDDRSHDDRRSTRDFDDSRDGDDVRRSDKDRANAPTFKATTTVAALDPTDAKNTNDLQTFFPADSEEQKVVSAGNKPRVMTPTPKYFLEGGGWVSSRGMSFVHNPPDSTQQAPDYPAQGLAGIAIQASIYPYPVNKLDFDPSGIGFSFGIQKSVGSLLSAYDPNQNTYGDYVIDNTAYNGAIH